MERSKKTKYIILSFILVLLLGIGSIYANWYINYEKANPLLDANLSPKDFIEVQFYEPIKDDEGVEDAYTLNKYSSTAESDIANIVEMLNGLRFTDELVSSSDVGVGAPRRLKLIAENEKDDMLLYLYGDMDAINLQGEEVLRYTKYPLFQNKNISELMEFEKMNQINLLDEMESIG